MLFFLLFSFALLFSPLISAQNQPCNACSYQNYQNPYSTTEDPMESTTEAPRNRFNDAGWETDDSGNVFIGDDNAKLYLISVGSYWPFPKDYRKKRSSPFAKFLRMM